MIPIDAESSLSCTLSAAEWNFVLGCIGEAPFRLAQPVIAKVMGQIEAQQQTAQAEPAADPPP